MRQRKDHGTSIVEFALILSLFFLLIFGILEFGRYFFVQHTLQFATREGMRLALVGRRLPDGQGGFLSRTESIIQTIRENASLAVDPSSLEIYVFPVAVDYSDPGNWQTPNAGNPGVYMRVRARYTYKFVNPLIAALFPDGEIVIEAQGNYRNELFDT